MTTFFRRRGRPRAAQAGCDRPAFSLNAAAVRFAFGVLVILVLVAIALHGIFSALWGEAQ